ncbi:sensor histidine kinase [Hyalangium rubrum]|uniref:histidine kinase n=1 Tax=Hyalangium rubrum TaxID=3103134 RepID=A0ABU5H360_9BACT|nr:ATP-binding protein [Hyalangium sp. s54d21]MDY7227756.1 ATP-binding protein [Hyalangium sp. s54d21]
MSVSTKVLLFAGVALLSICTLGGSLIFASRVGQGIRERLISIQEQLDNLSLLKDDSWHYLNAMREAREQGKDTAKVRREYQALLEEERVRLEQGLQRERQAVGDGWEGEWKTEEQQQIFLALRLWMDRAELRLRAEPEGVPVSASVHWGLYQEYEREVGQRISAIHKREWELRAQLRRHWNHNVQRGLTIAKAVTIGCGVLVIVLAMAILLPLRGSLRKLRGAAERIGQGDFEVAVPTMGRDELGMLAHAMNRMAGELRDTLQEKQRLVKAEAEASEREARRYSAMLEETVRARTSELETANARLEASFRQLQNTQELLLFSDRLAAVGRLAAGVGHEINNPLSYMISNLRFLTTELSRMGDAASPEHQELMEALSGVSEGAERVRLIVQDLRMLARPDDLALGPVELASVVRSASRLAEPEVLPRARMVLDCQDVPSIRGNGPRLVQVLLNLLINAAHSIEPGQVEENEIRVVVRLNGEGSVFLEVKDTGCGIPPENLERIFDPFFTTKPIGVGTGLGLSLCRSLVNSQGGSIQVESQVGRGTTFRVTLAVAS